MNAPPKPELTICVLLYGDYLDLAKRVLNDYMLYQAAHNELRVGLNACSPATLDFVEGLIHQGCLQPRNCYRSDVNLHKYPLMRRMFYDPDNPLTTEYTVWFDDDSYLFGLSSATAWQAQLLRALRQGDMVGAPYTKSLEAMQASWIEAQPWYTGKSVRTKGYSVCFITGGFWGLRSELLRQYDWPIPALDHRGGDVMFGELLRQQSKRLVTFRSGVAINADAYGNECQAPKRGFDSKPIGYDYQPSVANRAHTTPPR